MESMVRSVLVCLLTSALVTGCGGQERAAVTEPASVSARPAGTIVFASDGNRLTAIDVATGRRSSRRIRAVPACGALLLVTGGHIVFTGVVKGLTTAFAVPLTLDRPPKRLGAGHLFVPSATDGRVWIAGTDCDRPAMVGVREVAVDGRVTAESDRRVPGTWVDGAVPGGLIVHRDRTASVWDPRTGAERRLGLDAALGTHGSLVAGCAEDCNQVAIVDTAGGRRVTPRASGRHHLDPGGAFSPDGSLLATGAVADRRWSVALVDVGSGAPTIVPGSDTGRNYPELGWASSGWLFFRDGRRIKAYRPGLPRAATLPFRLPRSAAAFTAA